MKTDCGWISDKLEDYFSERLGAEQMRLLSAHLQTCEHCNQEVQSLRNVDELVRQAFRHRMSIAQSTKRAPRRVALPLALSAAGLALASVLTVALWNRPQDVPAPQVATAPPSAPALTPPSVAPSAETPDIKTPSTEQQGRAKPTDATAIVPKPRADAPVTSDAPVFAVTDAAGFSRTLADYRGSIVVFGRWSANQPETAHNLETLYKAFGSNTKIQVFGVSSRREDRLPGTSFPNMFNNGSQLLGARNGQFVVVDAMGKMRLRGSLGGNSDEVVAQVRNQLSQLGVK